MVGLTPDEEKASEFNNMPLVTKDEIANIPFSILAVRDATTKLGPTKILDIEVLSRNGDAVRASFFASSVIAKAPLAAGQRAYILKRTSAKGNEYWDIVVLRA